MSMNPKIQLLPSKLKPREEVLGLPEIEAETGVDLPKEWVALLETVGGLPCSFEQEVRIAVEEPNPLTDKDGQQLILSLFGLTNGPDGIATQYKRYADRLGERFLPIADDGLGNLFGLEKEDGRVLFWHHENLNGEASPDAFSVVKKTVVEFISGLNPVEEQDIGLLKKGIRKVSRRF